MLFQSCVSDLFCLCPQEGKKGIEYFMLGDLWDCYDELSAYGFGSHVDLNNGETVVQYYVPYLSAIQIHTNKPTLTSRFPIPFLTSLDSCTTCCLCGLVMEVFRSSL